jgi:glycosyltransferase involved in cell wall biosynthesis
MNPGHPADTASNALPPILAPGISVFFPAYNDAPAIASLVRTAFQFLTGLNARFEVIVVNDGSRDSTASELEALQAELGQRLRIVTHPVNRGYGSALRSGFSAARYPWVFYTDGDGQYDVAELALLLPRVAPDVGLVNGYKIRRHDPIHRVWIGRVYNRFIRLLFGVRLRDIDCDFRLIRRSIIPPSQLTANGGAICLELALLAESSRLGVVEVPVHHYPRLHGRSQFFRIAPLWNTFRELAALYYLRRTGPRFFRQPVPTSGKSRIAEGD